MLYGFGKGCAEVVLQNRFVFVAATAFRFCSVQGSGFVFWGLIWKRAPILPVRI